MLRRVTTRAGGSAQVDDEVVAENRVAKEDSEEEDDEVYEGDVGFDSQPMASSSQAFPYSLLRKSDIVGKETESQVNHFSATKMIAEKPAQRNGRFHMVVEEVNKISIRAPEGGKLDSEDVEEAAELLEDAAKDVKDYNSNIFRYR